MSMAMMVVMAMATAKEKTNQKMYKVVTWHQQQTAMLMAAMVTVMVTMMVAATVMAMVMAITTSTMTVMVTEMAMAMATEMPTVTAIAMVMERSAMVMAIVLVIHEVNDSKQHMKSH